MIELTRLNGNRLAVNSDLIQFAESAPDTLLTMVTGEKLLVSESLSEVAERVEKHRARTLAEAARIFPGTRGTATTGLRALAAMDAAEAAASSELAIELDEESAGRMRRRRRAES